MLRILACQALMLGLVFAGGPARADFAAISADGHAFGEWGADLAALKADLWKSLECGKPGPKGAAIQCRSLAECRGAGWIAVAEPSGKNELSADRGVACGFKTKEEALKQAIAECRKLIARNECGRYMAWAWDPGGGPKGDGVVTDGRADPATGKVLEQFDTTAQLPFY